MSATDRQRMEVVDPDLAGKYEILDVLGGGGMGRVLRARHRQLKTLVAIKLLQQDLNASDAVTRFLREARAAARIRSAHVARVMDTGVSRNGQPYIVMEYLRGEDLARRIANRGRLPVEEAVSYTLQALEAIAEAHSLQIIHRDIKPGNLFATHIAGETFIKVLDFGLAKTNPAFDTLDPGVTEKGAVLGTPSYMSPEQFINAQEVDARADIWGIGATLFELLTGTPPFRGTNLPQIYTAVMHRAVPTLRSLVPELPEGLEDTVATCLTRERELRYANLAELATALEPFAKPGDRERVARIHRVVNGLTDPTEDTDLTISAAEPDPLAGPLQGSVDAGAVISTFRRTSRGSPNAIVKSLAVLAPNRTVRAAWLLLLAAVLFGAAGSYYRTRNAQASMIMPAAAPSTGVDMTKPEQLEPMRQNPQAETRVEAPTESAIIVAPSAGPGPVNAANAGPTTLSNPELVPDNGVKTAPSESRPRPEVSSTPALKPSPAQTSRPKPTRKRATTPTAAPNTPSSIFDIYP